MIEVRHSCKTGDQLRRIGAFGCRTGVLWCGIHKCQRMGCYLLDVYGVEYWPLPEEGLGLGYRDHQVMPKVRDAGK